MTTASAGTRAMSAVALAAVADLLLYGFLAAESEKAVGLVLLGAVVAVAGGLRSGVLPRLVRAAGASPVLGALAP